MGDPGARYAAYTARLVDSVLASPGHTPSALRRAVFARAFGPHPLSPSPSGRGGTTPETSFPLSGTERGSGGEDLLAAYVDTVARHAYKVTDDDLAALERAGHSDDALFEVTISAALGAALARLERGLAALRGEEPD